MSEFVRIPDESGMGDDERELGKPFWDIDSRRWLVQVDQFAARAATDDELLKLARETPSESGYGWTLDLMTPFFPGVPCVHCGRFVGRNGIFNLEHFEMSDELASLDAEHVDCADAWSESVRRRGAGA